MKIFITLILTFIVFQSHSQAKLLKDIYPLSSGSKSLNPEHLLIGNTLYFVAKTKKEGNELWATDGTTVNTRLVKDISTSSFVDGDPHQLTNYQNKLYFTASDETNGRELWSSDGTTSGTALIKDIFPGASSSFLNNESGSFIEYNGKLYFGADESFASDRELFVSDGTTQGTKTVADFLSTGGLTPTNFIVFKNKLYFAGISENFGGVQLMTYDDVSNKISLVKKINTNGNSSSVSNLISTDNYFLFTASEATYGNEIYISDGTASGTKLLKDLSPGSASSTISFYGVIGSKVLFCLNNSLYVTDGTSNGTSSLNMDCIISGIISGNLLYFGGSNPNNNLGVELYVTDGTISGTKLIRDINTGSASSSPVNLTVIKNKLYFSATTPATGSELWESDGTDSGTKLLADIVPGTDGSGITRMIALNDKTLFFYANDGISGDEPWIYEFQTTASKNESKQKFNIQDIKDCWVIRSGGLEEINSKFIIRLINFEGQEIKNLIATNDELVNGLLIQKPEIGGVYIIKIENQNKFSSFKYFVNN
jgi:ELWxxDGT repeat protein